MKNNKQTVYPKKHIFFVLCTANAHTIYMSETFLKNCIHASYLAKKEKDTNFCQCLNLTEILIF